MKRLFKTAGTVALLSCVSFAVQAQDADYCNQPWAQVDGNSDGMISKAEASASVENQFGQIDTNGDGEVSKTEYTDCMSRVSGQAAAEADRNEQNFAETDIDQDSKIDRNEFRQSAQQAYEDGSAQNADEDSVVVLRRFVFLTPEESQDQSKLKNMSADEAAGRSALTFSALDQNSDDSLGQEEWSERSPQITRNEDWASANFDRIDQDSSGSISKEEYQSARQQMLDDQMSTGSTSASTSASTSGEASGSGSATQASDQGIPVYVYRFWTM